MSKKKDRKRSSKKTSHFQRSSYWKVQLQKSSTPYNVLHQIKSNLSAKLLEEILTWIQANPFLLKKFCGSFFPQENSEWASTPIGKTSSWDQEMVWCFYRIRPHFSKLSEFITIKKKYEGYFIRENYTECLKLLDEVERNFGLSIWLIKKRIHVLQYSKGLEDQKNYAKLFTEDPTFDFNLIPYLIHYISYRAETSVSSLGFAKHFNSLLSDNRGHEFVISYVKHHVLSQYIDKIDDLSSILNRESTGSLIDYYESLVSTSQMVAASDFHCQDRSLNTLYAIYNNTKDERLLRVVVHLGYKIDSDLYNLIFHDTKSYEKFVSGENSEVISLVGNSLNTMEGFFPENLLLLSIASLDTSIEISQNENWSKYPIVKNLCKVISCEGTSKTEKDELCRFAWSLDGSTTSHFLRCFIESEDSTGVSSFSDLSISYFIIGMGKYHPLQMWWSHSCQKLSDALYPKIENKLITVEGCIHSCDFCLEERIEKIGKEYQCWECSRQLILIENYDQSLEFSQRLTNSLNPFYKKQSVILSIHCLLKLGEIEKCIDSVTDFLVINPDTDIPLPLIQLMEGVTPEIRERVVHNISYPLLCHFYITSSNGRNPHLRSDAVEDFLQSHQISRPSQIRDICSHFSKEKLILFLHDLCVEQVLDTWIEFSSSNSVALERVEVCKLLSDLCPENNETYQSEIRDIIRRITIRKRITEVEKSKIYVDTESVKKSAKRILSEDYDRYNAFCSSGISIEHKKTIESALKSLRSGNVEEFLNLNFPRNEMRSLLEKMVVTLRDEFVASSQHGLDGYLSVRIRHGTLEGQLRSAFGSEDLLTQKCFETNEYTSNQHWLNILSSDDDCDSGLVENSFQEFSAQFDDLIRIIKTEWVQIKKSKADSGKIDFTLLNPEIDYISSHFTEETSLDQFIDFVLDYFVSVKLDSSLRSMREGIQNEIKPRFNDLLTQLQTSIEKNVQGGRIHELRSAIGRARTSGQNTLDRISGWFRLSKTESKEPFSVEEVISISESSIKASCGEFYIQRNIDSSLEGFLFAAKLPSFVDLLCLIFDNIVCHSGLENYPCGTISVKYSESYLRIQVENEVSDSSSTVVKKERVSKIKYVVNKSLFSPSVSKEGGTGFFKVKKILNHDFSDPNINLSPDLDFGFTSEKKFFVNIGIPIHSVKTLEVE